MGFVTELWAYIRARRKYWLMPVIFFVLALGGLMVIAQSSTLAPFIYALF